MIDPLVRVIDRDGDDVRMGGSSRARVRRTGVVAVVLLVGSAVTAVVLARRYHLDAAATLVGLVGGVTGLTGLWLAWAAYRADREEAAAGAQDLAGVADQLALAVRRQWEDEAALRRLNDPYPLPVRWVAADSELTEHWESIVRLATSGAGWPLAPRAGSWVTAPSELAGGDNDLVGLLERVPTGRLVVLGGPGAGKTMLAVRLVLDLLADGRRAAGGPVPVLVSLASWNPTTQTLHDWLSQRLTADYPSLAAPAPGDVGTSRAQALLDAGLILAVLDGLDEIGEAGRARAIIRINDALRPGQRVVLTCRRTAYQQAISERPGLGVHLAGAAGIQLCPLDSATVAYYLRMSAGSTAGAARWDILLTAWPPPVAQALRTPLTATLARTIYNPRPDEPSLAVGDSPDELLDPIRFPTRTAVEQHLFDGFIPAAYRPHPNPARRCRWQADDAERWLVFLARHLEHALGGSVDLAWWQLPEALSPRQRALQACLVGLAGAFAGCLAAWLTIGPLGLTIGVGGGLALWISVGHEPDHAQSPRWAVRWNLPEADLLVVGLVLGLSIGMEIGLGVGLVSGPIVGLVVGLVVAVTVALAPGFYTMPLDLAAAVSPPWVLRKDRAAFRSIGLVGGLISGLLVGTMADIAGGLTNGIIGGVVFGTLGWVALGFGLGLNERNAVWGRFALTRAWLSTRGRLPRDLMGFLADAHEGRGVLRQVGAVYQFRHAELQRRLANR
ncbi:NACHT domain-containing protein [Pseudofrankia sp. BMG5.36]|uniref:NACHT domain-containing protein n=1 Tax=Pseudofrankia sp. BMG5.36 TaxID=1834512 RepID=UPI001F52A1B4|nr:NACHT domain-containing protein [Pseudofrankia sp. BMG5.36]